MDSSPTESIEGHIVNGCGSETIDDMALFCLYRGQVDARPFVRLTTEAGVWRGQLLSWRWIDQDAGKWTGLVRYKGPQDLQYEGWFPGEQLERISD